MSQMDDGLSLDAVVRRFADSERALQQMQEKLQSLASSAETADASATSLRESAAAVRGFAEGAAAAAEALREVSAEARRALESAAAVLDASALRAIEERLEELVQGQKGLEQRLGALDQIAVRVQRIDTGTELTFNTLPGRWRKEEYPAG